MPQETLKYTVKWFMPDKKLIKFNESAEDYTLSSTVAKFDHAKVGIKAGVKVDVSIVGKEVTYLRKSDMPKRDPDQPQPAKEEPQAVAIESESKDVEYFTWVVSGLPADKKVIAFKDNAVKWYLVPEELRPRLDEIGVKARVTVKVSLQTLQENGKDKLAIHTIDVVEAQEAPKNESPTQEGVKENPELPKSGRSQINNSIERQCAWKTAGETISHACQGQVSLNDVDILTAKIKALAEEGIKFIQGQ